MNYESLPSDYQKGIREDWDRKFAAGWGKDMKPAEFFLDFYEKYRPELGDEVLDVGSGRGRYLVPLAKEGFKVIGLDPSEEGRAATQIELKKAGVAAPLVAGQSRELPFADQSFDFVLSIGAIHHNTWNDINKSFAEISRVLKSGKLFLFQGRSVSDQVRERQAIDDHGYTAIDKTGSKTSSTQHYFTEEELQQLANNHGFSIMEGPVEKITEDPDQPGKPRARWWLVLRKKEAEQK